MSAGTLTWDPGLGCHRPWRDVQVEAEMMFREEPTGPGDGRPACRVLGEGGMAVGTWEDPGGK